MQAGNLVKDKGFLCLLIIPCIFDEGKLVDKEIFCFLTKRNIPCCMRNEENTGFKFPMRTIENEAIMILYDENTVTDFIIFYIFIDLYSGAELSRLPQVFFKNIKMRPKYNKKCYNHTDSFAAKVVIVIDNLWIDMILDTGCVTFNLVLCLRGARQIFYCIFVWPI